MFYHQIKTLRLTIIVYVLHNRFKDLLSKINLSFFTVTDMCQTGLAIEQIGESQYGTKIYDHVTLRARTQEDNCTCLVFIENQSLDRFQMYFEPYDTLPSSAPKEAECGLELYLDVYQIESLQQSQIEHPIKCTSGQSVRALSFKRNSVFRFTSNVINGNFTRGYCIDIQRGNFI